MRRAMAQERRLSAPVIEPGMEPFWNAAKEGRLLVKRCETCTRLHWYPRVLCPYCLSDQTHWQQVSGHGTLYSYTVMRRAEPRYAIAYVTLEEGVTMLTNIVDCDFATLRIGAPVQVTFRATEGDGAVLMFRPVEHRP